MFIYLKIKKKGIDLFLSPREKKIHIPTALAIIDREISADSTRKVTSSTGEKQSSLIQKNRR